MAGAGAASVAMVFGASRGIGKGIATGLAAAGTHVVVLARERGDGRYPGSAEATVAEIKAGGGSASALTCEVSDAAQVAESVQRVASEHGRIDVVVNSAVLISSGRLDDIDAQEWDQVFAVNVRGPYLVTRAALDVMRAQGSGHVVHLTGSGAHNVHQVNALTGASKAALERFVAGAAAEVAQTGVGVSLFDPGRVRTERAEVLQAGTDWTGVARPSDVAKAFVDVVSQSSSAANGHKFVYDRTVDRQWVAQPLLS